jgi:hypothetical protein
MQWKPGAQKVPSSKVGMLVVSAITIIIFIVLGTMYFWANHRSVDQYVVMKILEMGIGADYLEIDGEALFKPANGSADELTLKYSTKMDKGAFVKDVNYHNVFRANISSSKGYMQINYEIIKSDNVEYIKISNLQQILSALADRSELENTKEGLQLLNDLITKYDNKWLEVDSNNDLVNGVNINAYKLCSGINVPLKLDDELEKKMAVLYKENKFLITNNSEDTGLLQNKKTFIVDRSKFQSFFVKLKNEPRLKNLNCTIDNLPKDTKLEIAANRFTNKVSEIKIHTPQVDGVSRTNVRFNNTSEGENITKPQHYTKLSTAQQELEDILGISIADLE